MSEFVLEIGSSWIVRFLISLILIIIVFRYYQMTIPPLKPLKKFVLILLRTMAILILIMIVSDSLLILKKTVMIPDKLFFVVDNSKSISLGNSPDSLREKVFQLKAAIHEKLNIPVVLLKVGKSLEEASQPDDLNFDDSFSNLSSIDSLMEGNTTNRIILMTDGRWNAGINPELIVQDHSKMPIDIIPVGLESTSDNYGIDLIHAPFTMFIGKKNKIVVRVYCNGTHRLNGTLMFSANGKQIIAKKISSSPNIKWKDVILHFTPAEVGEYTLHVRYEQQGAQESFTDDNRVTRHVFAGKEKKSVLLLTRYPDAVIRFLKKYFEKDDRINLIDWFPGSTISQFPDLNNIDAIILWNFSLQDLPKSSETEWTKILRKPLWINIADDPPAGIEKMLQKFKVKTVYKNKVRSITPQLNHFLTNLYQDERKNISFWYMIADISEGICFLDEKKEFTSALLKTSDQSELSVLMTSKNISQPVIISALDNLWQWKMKEEVYREFINGTETFLGKLIDYFTMNPDNLIKLEFDPIRDYDGKNANIRFLISPYILQKTGYMLYYEWKSENKIVKSGMQAIENTNEIQKLVLPVTQKNDMMLSYSLQTGSAKLMTKHQTFSFGNIDRESNGTINRTILEKICNLSHGHYFQTDSISQISDYYLRQIRNKIIKEEAFPLRKNASIAILLIILLVLEWIVRRTGGLS